MSENRKKRDKKGRFLPPPGLIDTKKLIDEIVDWGRYFASVAGKAKDADDWPLSVFVEKARGGYVIDGISADEIKKKWLNTSDPDNPEYLADHLSKILSLLLEKCLPKLAIQAKREELKYREVVNITAIPASMTDGDFINLSSSSAVSQETQRLEEELLKCQQKVIDRQEKVIELQDQKLGSISETVEKDLKSWGAVVSRNCAAAVSVPRLQAALQKSTKQDEDETRKLNLMVFGLPENASETDPAAEVTLLLLEIGEKPPISACTRIGVRTEGSTRPRPIKATFSSRESLLSILRKARDLRNSPNYSSHMERGLSSGLLANLSKRTLETVQRLRTENPDKQYTLRGGVIECV
eukprot:sb/3466163/